jgi:hypothetical protein
VMPRTPLSKGKSQRIGGQRGEGVELFAQRAASRRAGREGRTA